MAYIQKALISACLFLGPLSQMGCGPTTSGIGAAGANTPVPPVVMTGTIRWPKALGHPQLTSAETSTIGIGGQEVTYCAGFSIQAWPSGVSHSEDTNHPGVTVTCRQKPEDATNYNLQYQITYSRSAIMSAQCKYVTIKPVPVTVRRWTPSPSDPNGAYPPVFRSYDSDVNCDNPMGRLPFDILSEPGELLDPSIPFGGTGIANFVGSSE